MTSDERIAQLEQIVARVQRKGRNTRAAFVFSMLVVVVAAAVAHLSLVDRVDAVTTGLAQIEQPRSPDYVHEQILAKKIIVLNESGDPVVQLMPSVRGDGSVRTISARGDKLVTLGSHFMAGRISTFYADGSSLVTIDEHVGSGRFTMHDANAGGKRFATLGRENMFSRAVFATFDPAGKNLVTIGSDLYGAGEISTYNAEGKRIIALGSSGKESGMIDVFYAEAKHSVVRLEASSLGFGTIMTRDSRGQIALSLSSNLGAGGGGIIAYGPEGNDLLHLSASEYGGHVSVKGAKDPGDDDADGKTVVSLGVTDAGEGLISTYGADGKALVRLMPTIYGSGSVSTYSAEGNVLVTLTSTEGGNGSISTHSADGKDLIFLTGSDGGGSLHVFNKTGERVVDIFADEYGMGYVGAFDRQGKGRTLQPK